MLGLLVETLESNFEFESMIKLGFDWDKCDLMMNMTIWLILIYNIYVKIRLKSQII